jgi:hypothetical protein
LIRGKIISTLASLAGARDSQSRRGQPPPAVDRRITSRPSPWPCRISPEPPRRVGDARSPCPLPHPGVGKARRSAARTSNTRERRRKGRVSLWVWLGWVPAVSVLVISNIFSRKKKGISKPDFKPNFEWLYFLNNSPKRLKHFALIYF